MAVTRAHSLACVPQDAGLDAFADAYQASGFHGGLNLYRNLDRNADLMRAFAGRQIERLALYAVNSRDMGLAIHGMAQIIAGQRALVPDLRDSLTFEGCGHWLPQERPNETNRALLASLESLA